ncbi:Protein kinase domain [Dillenia turbinata]|uniref:non-specific serine/threonine protein kinase n=1 Tax=Dillenia turbinata TaxID=194707 RepID=A0AAN8VQR9_9MAGN
MSDAFRNGGGDFTSDTGIPSGLNRIKTRRPNSKNHSTPNPSDSNKSADHRNATSLFDGDRDWRKPSARQKPKTAALDRGRFSSSKEGLRKGKIANWFTSLATKDSNLARDASLKAEGNSEIQMVVKVGLCDRTKQCKEGKRSNKKDSSSKSVSSGKTSKGLKSFSHELGPKGGIPPMHSRAHSYSDLEELLGSFRSKFDSAKELVNSELATFAADVMDFLHGSIPSVEEQKMAEDLLILAHQCREMLPSEFRSRCEVIVQDLTGKREHCQTGLLKWLLTRMLFILTRCTRVLQFQRDSEPINKKSLRKFKKCLESIPAVEMSWIPDAGVTSSGTNFYMNQKSDMKNKLQFQNVATSLPKAGRCSSTKLGTMMHGAYRKDSVLDQNSFPHNSQIDFDPPAQQTNQADCSFHGKSANISSWASPDNQEHNFDESDLVICRICEEMVPKSHLESHSYICAYADKCDLSYLEVDERLLKLAEVLEQIIESCNLSLNESYGSPESSRVQSANAAIIAEGCSPKISEWRNKGVEGMFEDLHEMDTACIDDFHLVNSNSLKGYLGLKFGHYGAPSSSGSLTSVSSANTPRGHFDFFWLEHNNPSELEDVQQMMDLADIAQCVASTDISKEGCHEYLLACMQDLQDVLQHSRLKALVIDTFGGRIENLLREKYLLACDLMDTRSPKSDSRRKESGMLLDCASQNSTMSTPSQPSHKERTSIDDFEIIKPISRGAFGKVYLARKRATGDLFAMKVLKKLDMIRKNDIERILAERNILITVRNPFVVKFFYSFTCRDNLYLVMEYLNGGDLYSLLRKVGCLEEDVARIYVAELVLALEYLHSIGIVHRDLKPDNILIAHDGHIKLTDFGLSKIGLINSTVDLSGSEKNANALAEVPNLHMQQIEEKGQQSAVGTPDYLAPEILLGSEHGCAADWWSVGIILFELLTGIPPFTAKSPEIIFDNILNKKIPWPCIPSEMSHEAQDLIDRFLTHDPGQRLGGNGASEVKLHSFFQGVNWDTLAQQKAAFVPQPDSADDTSYFVSRYSHMSIRMLDDQNSSDSASNHSDLSTESEEMDECGDLVEFDSSPLHLSLLNFSFKNSSQLASINHDLLVQGGKDPSKCSPSSKFENSL